MNVTGDVDSAVPLGHQKEVRTHIYPNKTPLEGDTRKVLAWGRN